MSTEPGQLHSAFVPDIRKANPMPIGPTVLGFIQKEFEAESLPPDRLGVFTPAPPP